MLNRFERGLARLRTRLGDQTNGAGVSVTYHRDTSSGVIRGGWWGKTAFRIIDNDNSRVEWSDRDWICPVNLLILDSIKVIPLQGDWLTATLEAPYGVQRFEVSAPDNEQVFRYSDPQCTIYRIHLKRMAGT